MIKLTVMYNLPPGADHEAFMRWRTTEHQAENVAMPGLIKTDFYVITDTYGRETAPYRYLTEAYFPDMETFRKTFYDPDYQAGLQESLKRIADPVFLISEEVISEVLDKGSVTGD
jgi:EthD domain